MPSIKTLKTKNLVWVNVDKPNSTNINYLKKNFKFHELDLEACLPSLQHPKVVERPFYLFMILLFPVYDRKTKRTYPSEIDFFIGSNMLVTVHSDQLTPVNEIFKKYQNNPELFEKKFNEDFSELLYEILNGLLQYCFPMLNHLAVDVNEIESEIFAGKEKKMIQRILNVKQNIVNFRKSMQNQKNVMNKLIAQAPKFISLKPLKDYYTGLVDLTKDIWDILENLKETIHALEESNNSLVSFKLNDIMRSLTLIAVIIFPLQLIASIFVMHTTSGMPFLGMPYDFWMVIGLMAVVALLMVVFYKRKKWFY